MTPEERATRCFDALRTPTRENAVRLFAAAIRAAVLAERERCALVAEGKPPRGIWSDRWADQPRAIAAAIRALPAEGA